MNCRLRIADCGLNVDWGFRIADWHPRSALRNRQSIRNPQSEIRNDEGFAR